MFRKKVKKAFTLVELLVVIAILAILATVSVVGYTQFTKRAQQSNDMSLTTQINTVLQADEVTGKPEYPTEAIAVMEEAGANIAALSPTTEGYSYVYNLKTNRVILLDENKNVVAPEDTTISDADKVYCYAMVHSEEEKEDWIDAGYSVYLSSEFSGTSITVDKAVGIDVGESNVTSVSITGTEANTATIYTNGGNVTIDAKNATINHYGTAGNVTVMAVDQTNSYHLFGTVELDITVKVGHIVIEAGASASAVLVDGNNVSIKVENNATLNSVGATQEGFEGVEIDANVEYDVVVGDSTAALYFAGGAGTEENPWLIATAEQFKNIDAFYSRDDIYQDNLTTINGLEKRYYFELTNDLALTYEQVSSSLIYNAEIDGGAKVITVPRENILFSTLINSKLSNVTVNFSGGESSIVTSNYYSNFNNVTTTGESAVSGNVGLFTIYLYYYVNGTVKPVTFTNCTNRANVSGTGTYSDYNAVFVGYVIPYRTGEKDQNGNDIYYETVANLTFTGCANEGTFICGKAAMFVGNIPNTNVALDIKINDFKNTGTVRATFEGALGSPIAGTYSSVATSFTMRKTIVTIDNVADPKKFSAVLNGGAGFEKAEDSGMDITGEEGGLLTITESNNEEVDYYIAYVGTYVTWLEVDENGNPVRDENGNYKTVGSYRVYITERIEKEKFVEGKYKSEKLRWIGFTTNQTGEANQTEFDVSKVAVTSDRAYYIIPNCDACMGIASDGSLVNTSAAGNGKMISVSAFDADGNLIASNSVYKG